MKTVNVTFEFAKDCPYNLDGTCVFPGIGLTVDNTDCSNGRCKKPQDWCPLPEPANSDIKEQKITTHNKQSTKPCPWCNGKGYRFKGVNYQDDCVVCNGSGWVKASYIC